MGFWYNYSLDYDGDCCKCQIVDSCVIKGEILCQARREIWIPSEKEKRQNAENKEKG